MKNGSVISTSSVPRRRRVGARDDPGEQDRERQRQHRLDQRDRHRVEQHAEVLGGQDRAVAVEIELARRARRRRMQAAVEQHRQRVERQEGEQQDQQRDAGRPAEAPQAARREPRPGGFDTVIRRTPIERSRAVSSRRPGRSDSRTGGCAAAVLCSRAQLFRRQGQPLQQAERAGAVCSSRHRRRASQFAGATNEPPRAPRRCPDRRRWPASCRPSAPAPRRAAACG